MIITGVLTLIVGLCFWFFIPDNPMKARFLSREERVIAVERLRNQSTGVENKTWKREQFWEALRDWKPWAVSVQICLRKWGVLADDGNSLLPTLHWGIFRTHLRI